MSRVTGTGPRPGPWVQVYKLLYRDKYHEQGWIKCGSREHRSQEITRKIEEIVTLGYEKKKEKREEEERGEKGKKKMRKEKRRPRN